MTLPDNPAITADDLPKASDYNSFHPFIKGVFSQWHKSPFELENRTFVTAEQWMMFSKASLFGDQERANQIVSTDDPSLQKRLGALVEGFDQPTWDKWKVEIVYRGNNAKFNQNPGAARQLKNTGEAMLVEANVRDWIWGNGINIDDPQTTDPLLWKGQNLLGRILTLVKAQLNHS